MKVRLKPNIDIDKYPILDCQDKSRNLYLNFDTIYEIAEITITKLEKERYEFKYHIITKENEYGCYFPTDIFNIVDNKIDDDWSVVEDDTTITMAPKSINYPEFGKIMKMVL